MIFDLEWTNWKLTVLLLFDFSNAFNKVDYKFFWVYYGHLTLYYIQRLLTGSGFVVNCLGVGSSFVLKISKTLRGVISLLVYLKAASYILSFFLFLLIRFPKIYLHPTICMQITYNYTLTPLLKI